MNVAKAQRIDRGLTRAQVCLEAGISAPTLRKIEQGVEAEAPTLKKLGDFYGVEPHTLLLDIKASSRDAA